MADTSLNLIVIRSANIERAAQFYGLLGLHFEKHQHGKGALHYAAELGAIVFEIYPRKNDYDSTASVRIGFRVASVDDTVMILQQAGGHIVTAPHQSEWGRRAVIEDSDGHRIELTETAS